jgi:hypothetical protein
VLGGVQGPYWILVERIHTACCDVRRGPFPLKRGPPSRGRSTRSRTTFPARVLARLEKATEIVDLKAWAKPLRPTIRARGASKPVSSPALGPRGHPSSLTDSSPTFSRRDRRARSWQTAGLGVCSTMPARPSTAPLGPAWRALDSLKIGPRGASPSLSGHRRNYVHSAAPPFLPRSPLLLLLSEWRLTTALFAVMHIDRAAVRRVPGILDLRAK